MQLDNHTRKIGFFLPWLKNGGTEIAMLRVMNALAERGDQVSLVVHRPGNECALPVHPQATVTVLGGSLLSLCGRYKKWLRSEEPTAVFSAINHANIINAWCGYGHTKVIALMQNHLGEKLQRLGKPGERFLKEQMLRQTLPRATNVIAVSREIQRYLIEDLGIAAHKAACMYNPVPVAEVRKQASRSVAFPDSGGRPVLVASGRMATQKGFDVVIRSLAEFTPDNRPMLWLLGDGELIEEHKSLAKVLSLESNVTSWAVKTTHSHTCNVQIASSYPRVGKVFHWCFWKHWRLAALSLPVIAVAVRGKF